MSSPESADAKYTRLPAHIAIIPDGNGRWAEKRGLPRLQGHTVGADNMFRLVDYLTDYPIKYVTLYGFSTENWNRPREEVDGLFDMLVDFIGRTTEKIHEKGIRLRHIGRMNELPQALRMVIGGAVELTQNNTGMNLTVAFNYGARAEIVDAVRNIIQAGVSADNVTEESFENYLYTDGFPDVDLLIRTGDETRLSNFLIWQTTYSEYYFTKVLWPDFGKKDIEKALQYYSTRNRRFGGL